MILYCIKHYIFYQITEPILVTYKDNQVGYQYYLKEKLRKAIQWFDAILNYFQSVNNYVDWIKLTQKMSRLQIGLVGTM